MSFAALPLNTCLRKLPLLFLLQVPRGLSDLRTLQDLPRMTGLRRQDGPPLNKMLFFLSQSAWLSEKKANPLKWGWLAEGSDFASGPQVTAASWGCFHRPWGTGLPSSSSVSIHCLLPLVCPYLCSHGFEAQALCFLGPGSTLKTRTVM